MSDFRVRETMFAEQPGDDIWQRLGGATGRRLDRDRGGIKITPGKCESMFTCLMELVWRGCERWCVSPSYLGRFLGEMAKPTASLFRLAPRACCIAAASVLLLLVARSNFKTVGTRGGIVCLSDSHRVVFGFKMSLSRAF